MTITSTQQHPGARLRALMQTKCIGLPGAFNALVARAVADAGFEGMYVSGAAVTTSCGVPDIGLLTLNEFTHIIRQVTQAADLPTIADADTGFGEGETLIRTVWEYHRAGAAGLHIEDQVFPKRCGHLDDKALIPTDAFADKVNRAAQARDACSTGDFIVCARTDAAGVEGLDSAIDRARAYLDAGADMIFPEGLHSLDDFKRVADALKSHKPDAFLLANMTEFGKTPIIPLADFAAAGYSCVIWPVTTLRTAMGAVTRMLQNLHATGSVAADLDAMQPRSELYRLLGYTPGREWHYPNPRS